MGRRVLRRVSRRGSERAQILLFESATPLACALGMINKKEGYDAGNAKLSTATAREQNRALGPPLFEGESPGGKILKKCQKV